MGVVYVVETIVFIEYFEYTPESVEVVIIFNFVYLFICRCRVVQILPRGYLSPPPSFLSLAEILQTAGTLCRRVLRIYLNDEFGIFWLKNVDGLDWFGHMYSSYILYYLIHPARSLSWWCV